jgi:hypothetical protein
MTSRNNTIFTQIGGSFLDRKVVESGLATPERPFSTFVVKEIYDDPGLLTNDLRDLLRRKVANSNYVNSMPVNSIVGIDIENEKGKEKLLYPFFSQHLCLPVKPGEEVWVYREGNLYYWLSRKAGSYQSEDPNYTHIARQVNVETQSDERSAKSAWNNESTTTSTLFPEGHTDVVSSRALGSFESFDDIIKNSSAYQNLFQPEPVPRIVKNPGDLVLQGSNNTSIVLGTNAPKGKGKGTIDLVAGREVNNQVVLNDRNYQEIDKQLVASNDAPVNFESDKTRLYLTMFDNVDSEFSINIDGIGGSNFGAASVLKSDQIRLIARNDIKITVGDTGAGIVIKSNGEIVIVPAATSVIKLGGDDADKAILCQDATQITPGTVTAAPVISTAGGIIGASAIAGTGVFASKILVK